jgi:hypothetical protein
MTAFNPIASMQRLEAAGFKRAQAETLADELRDATSDLVTNEQLTQALTLRPTSSRCASAAFSVAC